MYTSEFKAVYMSAAEEIKIGVHWYNWTLSGFGAFDYVLDLGMWLYRDLVNKLFSSCPYALVSLLFPAICINLHFLWMNLHFVEYSRVALCIHQLSRKGIYSIRSSALLSHIRLRGNSFCLCNHVKGSN